METPLMHDNDLAMLEEDVLFISDTGPEDEESDDLFEDEDGFELDELELEEFDDFEDDDY